MKTWHHQENLTIQAQVFFRESSFESKQSLLLSPDLLRPGGQFHPSLLIRQ